ncbi:hypothetical protein SAMN05216436_12619 [bacterium A37T11]|nr:hypothetical protein SAMN05216436_12619 [bacterium A37T11]
MFFKFFWLLLFPIGLFAQDLNTLKKLGYQMYNEPGEPERMQANYAFIPALVNLLKSPRSFDHPLDSLKMISIQYPPDRSFRIFSWFIQLADGSYRYFGAIQRNTKDGSLNLFPLVDQSSAISDPQLAVLNSEKWLGAQYYRVVELDKTKGIYILLGWKGKNLKTTQKVLEILQFKNNEPLLGATVFNAKGLEAFTRIIYEYSKQAAMYMEYDAASNRIVVDHLAASEDKYQGDFAFYGPDMSQDAWIIQQGKLQLQENIPFKKPGK